ncbi:2-oxoacid:ferredoxin oxidoreductase subunit gamma [Deferribacter autotrophicus]|uniref:2-oxoacid:ferredoxin oxidoreductase subunit gamma n=1 Tax=Deferribacter autotrophicus TaxID=500465 RepID=A0A5A8F234_9BACT|nr:2-oxoacid:acceptor oxidoreductase family protein [Deferribacter autotrophicus]KAA0258012.1 2-oxoacid:ferredoxin oxidoreductase subunit gamma [Deferribacter autotrophicus]
MFFDCIMAGFGGQGILSAGMILAQLAVRKDLNVTWWPSYGAEQRGGTANCTVIISDEEIGSPIVSKPSYGFIMNRPSLDKFQPRFKEGANVILDTSLVDTDLINRNDINFYGVKATEIANKLGNTKVANMVMIGSLLAISNLFELKDAEDVLYYAIPKKYHSLLPINREALKSGYTEVAKL